MILNVWTVLFAFLQGLSCALALTVLAIAARLARKPQPDAAAAELARTLDERDERGRLLALVLGALTVVELLAWPSSYALLASYVPALAPYGVMCAYGVAQVHPRLVAALEIAQPALLFGLAWWWCLASLDRRARSRELAVVRARLGLALAAFALALGALAAVYLASDELGRRVSCCTVFSEIGAPRIGGALGELAASALPPSASLALFFGANLALIALGVLFARRSASRAASAAPSVVPGAKFPAREMLFALLGLLNLALTAWTWIDVVAPRVLGLPHHPCVYELVTDTPQMGLAAAFAWVGNAGPALPLLVRWTRAREPWVSGLEADLIGACALALASELVLVGVSLI